MANISYTPTAMFSNRVNALFNNMLQTFVANGQILPNVQPYLVNEFNQHFGEFVNLIFNKFPLGTEPTDQQIQQYLSNLIQQMLARFAQVQRQAMYQPQYTNGVVVQPQMYNPMLANNGYQTTSLFTGQVQAPVPQQGGFYANPNGVVTPPTAPQAAPVNTQIVTPPQQSVQQPQPSSEGTDLKTWTKKMDLPELYNPPVLVTNTESGRAGTDVHLGWGDGKIVQYKDAATEEEIDMATIDTDRGFVSPKEAVETAIHGMRDCLSRERYISVNYNQLQAYEVPRAESEAVIKKLKEMAKASPANSKCAYIRNMEAILGELKANLKNRLEGIFILEFNMATMYGALYDNTVDPSDSSFKINSLRELLSYLDLEETVDAKVDKLRSQAGFRDRLNTVARSTILKSILDIQLSDPNTPEGLNDYIAVYGNVLVDGHPIRDIARYREMSLHTDNDGEKTPQALEAMQIYTNMIDLLLRYTVVRMKNRNVVYTTLPFNGMLLPNFRFNCEPQDLGGPEKPSSHCEYFVVKSKQNDPRTFTIFFQPCSNVLISYIAVRTSDDWIRLMPVKMMV